MTMTAKYFFRLLGRNPMRFSAFSQTAPVAPFPSEIGVLLWDFVLQADSSYDGISD